MNYSKHTTSFLIILAVIFVSLLVVTVPVKESESFNSRAEYVITQGSDFCRACP